MIAGQTALRARRARIATELINQDIDRRIAEIAAGLLIGYGISIRQVAARQPGDQTRKLINQALRIAREIAQKENDE